MNPEQVAVQVVQVVDVKPGDVVVVCPPPGEFWTVEQGDHLSRHLRDRFEDKGVDWLVLRANVELAAVRQVDVDALQDGSAVAP